MKKVFKSFGYAFKGFVFAYKTQLNLRIHSVLTLIALLLSWFLQITTNEWCWILLCVTTVICAELMNTALETLVDLVSPGFNEKAGRVKDVSAAAVTTTAVFALVVGCVIFIPKILALLNHAA